MTNIKPLLSLKLTLHHGVANLPVPSDPVNDGVALSTWRVWDGYGPNLAHLRIKADGPANLGPLGLYIVDDENIISLVALLNSGQPVDLTATISFAQQINGVGSAKRLICGGVGSTATPTPAANITVDAWPLLVKGFV